MRSRDASHCAFESRHAPAQPIDPRRNPSYPKRIHSAEGPKWRGLLEEWKKIVARTATRVGTLGNHPKRDEFLYVYAQMQGAIDQIADAVRRLPGEVGELYAEDKHRVDQAVAALERLLKTWETLG